MNVILFIGKEQETEHYAMHIAKQFAFCHYDSSKGDHDEFVKKTAGNFARAYLIARDMKARNATEPEENNVYFANGFKIHKGRICEIGKLEDTAIFTSEFAKIILKEIEGRYEVGFIHNLNSRN